ncbi:MAG: AAA family ATPase [Prevotellaceae bacterium]|jgi:predicted AAA+ superfamily ATPase|nr:AAA family ATPase [Prevotellaceae bacterium]
MIARNLANIISNNLWKNKAIIVMGARQVGKTSLLKMLFADAEDVLWLNADEQDVRALFENATSTILKQYFGKNKIIIIDEAQRINNIGIKLKLITDQMMDKQLIATGSSSFEFNWNPKKNSKIPQIFKKTYANSDFKIINKDNIEEFLI